MRSLCTAVQALSKAPMIQLKLSKTVVRVLLTKRAAEGTYAWWTLIASPAKWSLPFEAGTLKLSYNFK